MFSAELNRYLTRLNCTGKDLAEAADLSPSAISRFRNDKRLPGYNSTVLSKLAKGLAKLGEGRGPDFTEEQILETFHRALERTPIDQKALSLHLDQLIDGLGLNVGELAHFLNYDSSSISRIRSGQRQPANPLDFANRTAEFIIRNVTPAHYPALANLTGIELKESSGHPELINRITQWLCASVDAPLDDVSEFLKALEDFNLSEYTRINPSDFIQAQGDLAEIPMSRIDTGLGEMRRGQLDFLLATLLSTDTRPMTLYSDMPIEDILGNDHSFYRQWLTGIALALKKGIVLNMIHNLNRPMEEMLIGLKSWIPLYMTGQIHSYYFLQPASKIYGHISCVSGGAFLNGDYIVGYPNRGRYLFSRKPRDIDFGQEQASYLLKKGRPLMTSYRETRTEAFDTFLRQDAQMPGSRLAIRSAPPLFTLEPETLMQILKENHLEDASAQKILQHARQQRANLEALLKQGTLWDTIPCHPDGLLNGRPVTLPLQDCFFKGDVCYSKATYTAHFEQTMAFERNHPGYQCHLCNESAFTNIEIRIHRGKWAIISKQKSPAIHFVITHSWLIDAIEKLFPIKDY